MTDELRAVSMTIIYILIRTRVCRWIQIEVTFAVHRLDEADAYQHLRLVLFRTLSLSLSPSRSCPSSQSCRAEVGAEALGASEAPTCCTNMDWNHGSELKCTGNTSERKYIGGFGIHDTVVVQVSMANRRSGANAMQQTTLYTKRGNCQIASSFPVIPWALAKRRIQEKTPQSTVASKVLYLSLTGRRDLTTMPRTHKFRRESCDSCLACKPKAPANNSQPRVSMS